MEYGYSDGLAENVHEVLQQAGIVDYELVEYVPGRIEKIIGFLVHPVVSGLLIMAIIGGIYFEMQTPGIGFPLAVAVIAAFSYFAPLYLEGLAENWEILIFVAGVVLIGVEIFVVPGFGFVGITGISMVFVSLILSLVNNVEFDFGYVNTKDLSVAIMTVTIGLFGGFILSLYLGKRMFSSHQGPFKDFALNTVQNISEGI